MRSTVCWRAIYVVIFIFYYLILQIYKSQTKVRYLVALQNMTGIKEMTFEDFSIPYTNAY